MNAGTGLTAKQQRFVEEYIHDLNASQAARRAGYAPANVDVQGCRLLGNANVRDAVDVEIAARSVRTQVTQDAIVTALAGIAFSDMRMFAEWGPAGVLLKSSAYLGADACCVAEVSQTNSTGGGSLKIRLHDKVRALELLGRHVGLFTMSHSDQSGGYEKASVVLGGQRIYF